MRMTDRKRTVDIEMKVWSGSGYAPDWSKDFFEGLEYDEAAEAYIVENVDYCIASAKEWAAGEGDFSDETFSAIDDRYVFVNEA